MVQTTDSKFGLLLRGKSGFVSNDMVYVKKPCKYCFNVWCFNDQRCSCLDCFGNVIVCRLVREGFLTPKKVVPDFASSVSKRVRSASK